MENKLASKKIVKLYLVKQDNDHNSLYDLNRRYIKVLSKRFNGSTTYNGRGLWIDEDGKEFPDNITICELFVDPAELGDTLEHFFIGVAKSYKHDARQMCVSVVIDGEAYIVE